MYQSTSSQDRRLHSGCPQMSCVTWCGTVFNTTVSGLVRGADTVRTQLMGAGKTLGECNWGYSAHAKNAPHITTLSHCHDPAVFAHVLTEDWTPEMLVTRAVRIEPWPDILQLVTLVISVTH